MGRIHLFSHVDKSPYAGSSRADIIPYRFNGKGQALCDI